MRLYLDDDSVNRVLVAQLRQAGHHVEIPADIGYIGRADAVHLLHAVQESRVLMSHNHDDYRDLHNLVIGAGGSHSGIFALRKDQDKRRDMRPTHIVSAIARLVSAGVDVKGSFVVLNHWR